MGGAYRPVIVWFRNDLRLTDNAVLHLPEIQRATHLVGIYCLDDRFENARTKRFKEQAVAELEERFHKRFGAPLECYRGKPEKIIPDVVRKLRKLGTGSQDGFVVASEEVASYEKRVETKLQEQLAPLGFSLKLAWTYSLFHPDDLPFDVRSGDLPEPFTSFRKRIEDSQDAVVRQVLDVPTLKLGAIPLDDPNAGLDCVPGAWTPSQDGGGVGKSPDQSADATSHVLPFEDGPLKSGHPDHWLTFRGGESAANARLEYFVEHGLSKYKTKRNESVGWDYSTKLSPWLAAGNISPRQVYHRIRAYEEEHGESVHTYWCSVFEPLWRDFMRFQGIKYGNKLFFELGPAGEMPSGAKWSYGDRETAKRFKSWQEGRTGIPWVDGHMRELVHTGFMSNRGRQNVASFLVHNLHVDWREGAQFFQDQLIDHDVTSNWCNWASAAGVGTRGARLNRFNMDKQARDYDKLAVHARLWVPEVADVRPEAVHDLALRSRGSSMESFRSKKGQQRQEQQNKEQEQEQQEVKESGKGAEQQISAPYPPPIVRSMGGSRFENTRRLDRAELDATAAKVRHAVENAGCQVRCAMPPELRDKSSFGDVDLIVATFQDKEGGNEMILKAHEQAIDAAASALCSVARKGDAVTQMSLLSEEGFQVDLEFVPSASFALAVAVHAHGDFCWLLGRALQPLGLKLTTHGLFVRRAVATLLEDFLLSRDPHAVANFLGVCPSFFDGETSKTSDTLIEIEDRRACRAFINGGDVIQRHPYLAGPLVGQCLRELCISHGNGNWKAYLQWLQATPREDILNAIDAQVNALQRRANCDVARLSSS
ncbi:Cryptochrome DASH [Hondaea fermentalgiana]|uniref:Cryptochrome DASH n=1 Tax=Hondaea fermentalgiana TaxID=2315210 RepID=A0A2R5GHZ6_9STRA|nr:Cryptochrome DASH [Hondaea fermentalgiana]|eukprot:GBG30516.1 Cryptochrome DASH [Hondaea fermentalgiana]